MKRKRNHKFAELAAALERRFGLETASGSDSTLEYVRDLEAIVHELAHGAVLEMDPFEQRNCSFTCAVGRRISYLPERYGNMNEEKSLAVEFLVLRALGVSVGERGVLRFARNGMTTNGRFPIPSEREVQRSVDVLMRAELTKRRAEKVLGWIRQAAGAAMP